MMTDLGTVHKTNPTCHTNDFCEDNGPASVCVAGLHLSSSLHVARCTLQVAGCWLAAWPSLSVSQKCCTSFEFLETKGYRFLAARRFVRRAAVSILKHCVCILWCNSFVLWHLPKGRPIFLLPLVAQIYEIQIAAAKSYDPALGHCPTRAGRLWKAFGKCISNGRFHAVIVRRLNIRQKYSLLAPGFQRDKL